MARQQGSLNKEKDIVDIVSTKNADNEDVFLTELIKGKAKWNTIAKDMKEAGHNSDKELEYAEAYRIMINKFTSDKIE